MSLITEMDKILNKNALDSVLRANWTSFIDARRFIQYVTAQASAADFPIGGTLPVSKSTKITLSKAELLTDGLLLWAEFNVPIDAHKINVGTCEMILLLSGEIQPISIIGQTVVIK